MRRNPMIEELARILCRSAGNDPDATVLPRDYVIEKTTRGDLVLGPFVDRMVPGWTFYGDQARAMVNAGWTKGD